MKNYYATKSFLAMAAIIMLVIMPFFNGHTCAAEKVLTLQYSSSFPSTDQVGMLSEQWCREVEKRTSGRVKINYYAGSTLTPAAQTYDSIVQGIADLGVVIPAYTRGRFPLTEVLELPLGVKSGLIGTRLYNEYFKKFRPKEFNGVKVLYLYSHGPGVLHSRKPINKLEDIKGVKIRCNPNISKIVLALGGIPVSMPQTEAYDALQKGVVDATLTPYQPLEGWRFAEVIKYTTENYSSSYVALFMIVMNKDKWNSLPKDIQEVFEKASEEWIDKTGRLWDKLDIHAKEYSQSRGNKVIKLSSTEDQRWAQKVEGTRIEYVKAMKAKGLPGDQALQFCIDYVNANQK